MATEIRRRDFLLATAGATAALTLPTLGAKWVTGALRPARYLAGERNLTTDRQGRVFELASDEHVVRRLGATGTARWETGGLFNGDTSLNYPVALADGPDGNLYVADLGNARIAVLNPDGDVIGQLGGPKMMGNARDVAVAEDGTVYACDGIKHGVHVFSPGGGHQRTIGTWGLGRADLNGPTGVDLAPDGTVHVADPNSGRVQVYDRDGAFVRSITDGLGRNSSPRSVVVDRDGFDLVADTRGGRVHVIDPRGKSVDRLRPRTGPGAPGTPLGVARVQGDELYVRLGPVAPAPVFRS